MQFPVKYFFLVFFFFCPLFLSGQLLNSRNYSTADGLANNSIRSLFLDKQNSLWIGTENGISVFNNGSFKNLYKDDGFSHNSCWDICQDSNGNMWFASYGGGVTNFDGKIFKVFTTKDGLPVNKIRKVFSHKDKIYVGTEFGISIIDINSNKVITPKEVFPHFGVFIVTQIFEYKSQIYFSALNEGIFKIDNENEIPKVVLIKEFKNIYSVGVFDDLIYTSNKGFINSVNLNSDEAFFKNTFGNSVVWQYTQDKRKNVYASAWGIFDSNGGIFQIKDEKMIDMSGIFGIDSKSILNCIYDNTNDVLYLGTKDKGFYQIHLSQDIVHNGFDDNRIVDFEDNFILHQYGLTIESASPTKLSLTDFKLFQQSYILKNKANLPSYSKGFFELNFNIPANGIQFYGIVKHRKSYWINSNIGIFEMNALGKILAYVPIHTYKFGFTADDYFLKPILMEEFIFMKISIS